MTCEQNYKIANTLEAEKVRTSSRNIQLFSEELEKVKKSGLTEPSCKTLDEYCQWLSPKKTKEVKWDFLRYSWTPSKTSYQEIFKKLNQTIYKPHYEDYSNRLITHTINHGYFRIAVQRGFLPGNPDHKAVSLSSGQIVFKGDAIDGFNSETIFFDRKILDQVYTLQPYSDHDVEWEREMRAHEPINLDLALGVIPTRYLLNDFNYWGQLTCVCGRNTTSILETEYLKTGVFNYNILSYNT